MMCEHRNLTIGWYGKIPSLGDFVSRRLPGNFIDAWDNWLQTSMATSQEQLGETWLDIYLTSPIWRFILMPQACNNNKIWTGIIMPSIDKVGRHFPLTFATEIEPYPSAILSLLSAQSWYTALEQIALASLDPNISPDELDNGLASHSPPIILSNERVSVGEQLLSDWWLASTLTNNKCTSLLVTEANLLTEIFNATSLNLFNKKGKGKSIWWKVGFETNTTQLHGFIGLPPRNCFADLLHNTIK